MKKWGKFSKKRFRGDFLGGVVYRVLGCEIYNHLMEDILTP